MIKVRIEDVGQAVRLAKALAHELRIEIILAHANQGQLSATEIQRDTASFYSASHITYHQLILRDLDLLALVGSRRARGAREKFYDLTDFGREAVRLAVEMGSRSLQ